MNLACDLMNFIYQSKSKDTKSEVFM